VRRRDAIALLGGAAVISPLAARAQQHGPGRRIGVMLGLAENNEEGRRWLSTFEQALVPLGWINQDSVRFEVRWTGGDAAKIAAYATASRT
jgi:putative tryptophan/tyrosine transport system substrate-binding protein